MFILRVTNFFVTQTCERHQCLPHADALNSKINIKLILLNIMLIQLITNTNKKAQNKLIEQFIKRRINI